MGAALPKGDLVAAVWHWMLVVLKRKRLRPDQFIGPLNDSPQNSEDRLGFSADSLLSLIIEGAVEATYVDVKTHRDSAN